MIPLKSLNFGVLALALLALIGCGKSQFQPVSEADTVCTGSMAQIQIGDGYAKTLCGCAEGTNRIDPPATIQCTVSKGSTVHFVYSGSATSHQILSINSPAFSSSPISDPKDKTPYAIHPVTFSDGGTFQFKDAFDDQIKGNIVAR